MEWIFIFLLHVIRSNMNPEQQRIMIAEKCGYKKEWLHGKTKPSQDPDLMDGDSLIWRVPGSGYFGSDSDLPDYPNDLNAMHEAEKVLKEEQLNTYGKLLWSAVSGAKSELVSDIFNPSLKWCAKIAHATAHQRAEAFLKVFGLWKD